MEETFGSTCHGAGRAQVVCNLVYYWVRPYTLLFWVSKSRNKSRNNISYEGVLEKLAEKVFLVCTPRYDPMDLR